MEFDLYSSELGQPTEEQLEALKRDFQLEEDKARVYQELFSTEKGRYVLDDLFKRFVIGTRFNPALNYDECVKWGFIREGQVMAVNYIFSTVKYAQGLNTLKEGK